MATLTYHPHQSWKTSNHTPSLYQKSGKRSCRFWPFQVRLACGGKVLWFQYLEFMNAMRALAASREDDENIRIARLSLGLNRHGNVQCELPWVLEDGLEHRLTQPCFEHGQIVRARVKTDTKQRSKLRTYVWVCGIHDSKVVGNATRPNHRAVGSWASCANQLTSILAHKPHVTNLSFLATEPRGRATLPPTKAAMRAMVKNKIPPAIIIFKCSGVFCHGTEIQDYIFHQVDDAP